MRRPSVGAAEAANATVRLARGDRSRLPPPLCRGLVRRDRGAVSVEFAIASLLFLALVIGVIELGMVAYVYTTAVEATRLGARVAAVCDVGDTTVKQRMRDILPLLTDDKISITYPTSGCSATSCEPVTVRIQNLTVTPVIPFVSVGFPIPAYSTSVPGESLNSADNPLCI